VIQRKDAPFGEAMPDEEKGAAGREIISIYANRFEPY
jgi:hypothetical protein